jgi:hypothetical protein
MLHSIQGLQTCHLYNLDPVVSANLRSTSRISWCIGREVFGSNRVLEKSFTPWVGVLPIRMRDAREKARCMCLDIWRVGRTYLAHIQKLEARSVG